MKKTFKLMLLACLMANCLLLPAIAFAADDLTGLLNEAAGTSGAGFNTAVDETAMARVVGMVARIFISLIGVIFISYTIYGGFLWMTAAGNEESIKKAKNIIRDGVIGIIVILLAAAIYIFIRNMLIAGVSSNITHGG